MPLIIEEGNIRRPKIHKVWVDITDPGGIVFEDAPAELPIDFVFGANEWNATAR